MYTILVLAVVASVSFGIAPPSCGENEHFTSCGTACPVTCANRNDRPKFCTLQCVIGCECVPGFMKNAAGKCVREQDCDGITKVPLKPSKVCGVNEEFTKCGTVCPLTCANRNQGPLPCTRQCFIGCQCKKGFFKNAAGKCVSARQCDAEQSCNGPNQIFKECGSPCEAQCHKQLPLACPAMCKQGCFCEKGFVKTENGDCVREEDCPKIRPALPIACFRPNQIFKECGSPCFEECGEPRHLTCDWQSPLLVNKTCLTGCFCEKGFVRTTDGLNCVKREDCPKQAEKKEVSPVASIGCIGRNQVFKQCSSKCFERQCGEDKKHARPCPLICMKGCYCADGFFRNQHDECVKEEECTSATKRGATNPGEQCRQNEVYSACKGHCDRTCGRPPTTSPRCFTERDSCISGCVCKPGYARNKIHVCMDEQQCPSINAKRSDDTCTGQNEVFTACTAHCQPLCKLQGRPQICPYICKPGCTCQQGFFRNQDNVCVRARDC